MFIKIEIQGVTPLICNRFTDASAISASGGTSGSSAAQDRGSPHEIAESKLYRGLKNNLMIPGPNMLRCLIDGGAYHKNGQKKITTARESMLYACLSIPAAEIPIIHKTPWTVDTRAVRIPKTGGRILAHRPLFEDWRLAFEVELDVSIVNAKLLREVVDSAGKRVGLGDFRPACKGPYGRFNVIVWQELREPKPKLVAAGE